MEIVNAGYHRNGVGGAGFYTGIVTTADGRFLITIFPEYKNGEPDFNVYWDKVAVVEIGLAASGQIRMDEGNAWRGADNFDAKSVVRYVQEANDQRLRDLGVSL